ncbi:MAG: DUF1697 domain-containing protein [Pirellulaceae bacterium]
MYTWVALFRGINVGGKNILPMAGLRDILQSQGCQAVRTYIQSGNAVFQSNVCRPASLTKHVQAAIRDKYGFEPHMLMLSNAEMHAAVEANPYPEAAAAPKSLHFFFLSKRVVAPDLLALDHTKAASESYALIDRVFYLYAPDGIARSKLAAITEKSLGVATTARNFRTVEKLVEMITTH